MVVSRSSAKTTNMYVSQEIRDYISELVKPLATNNILEDIFKKLKEEIIFKLKENLIIKIEKLMSLRGKLPSSQIQLNSSLSNVMIMNNIADAVV